MASHWCETHTTLVDNPPGAIAVYYGDGKELQFIKIEPLQQPARKRKANNPPGAIAVNSNEDLPRSARRQKRETMPAYEKTPQTIPVDSNEQDESTIDAPAVNPFHADVVSIERTDV